MIGRLRSLRASLGWLLAAMLLPLVAAGAAFITYQWRHQRALAVSHLEEHARALQRAIDRELALDQAVLQALATSRDIDAGDWAAVHASAERTAATRPGSWVVIYRTDGQNLVNTSVPYGTPLPNYRALLSQNAEVEWNGRALPLPGEFLFAPFATGAPSFSGVFWGPVTRQPVVASVVPVVRDGATRYAIALAYAADFFVGLLEAEQSPDGATTAILDGDGRFVARNRAPERFVGRRGPEPLARGRLAPEGVGEGVGVEGARMVYAYRRSEVNDWVAAAALPRRVVLAPAWRALGFWLAVLASAGLTGTLLALRLWRRVAAPLGALAHQAQALADPSRHVAATGIEEVEALRLALADAATSERLRRTVEREREEAREALGASEARLRAIFEDAAVGIVEVDAEGRYVAVNGRFCRMLGYEPGELLGKTVQDLTAPEDAEITRELNAKGYAGAPRAFEYEKRYLRRDGSRLWVHVTVSVVRDAAGRFVRAIGTAEDVSASRRAEAALREANDRLHEADRRKDEFLAVLSHELRNPLAPIRNSLYILDRADPAGAQAARAREVVNRQIAHLTRLVDDLLDVTRIARGKVRLRRAPVDAAELARRAAEDHRSSMEHAGIALEVDAPAEPVVVDADDARVTQILGNLLQNARKFTAEGGRVAVRVAREGEDAVIRVRDDGVGIDPELLPQLFEPFAQAKQTLARSEGGLGLGLALVKGLAELHGGEVTAASGGPGSGTEFTVRLPLAARAGPVAGDRPRAAPRARPHHRVLVVDDNVDSAESLAELVRLLGHEADVAYDGPSAVEKVRASRPEVVFCDLGLPGMSGYDVARAVRAGHDGTVRLVAVSGYARPEDLALSAEAGFDAHVPKPADPARLEQLLA